LNMTKKEKNKEDIRHFYAIVVITLVIVGFSVWQIFFTDPQVFIESNPQLERVPRINFTLFDSHIYQRLDLFERGDDLFPEWKTAEKKNPFASPEIPTDDNIFDWWKVFGFQFIIEEGELKGERPDLIDGQVVPDLYIFEGRNYKIKWIDDTKGSFEIRNDFGETILTEADGLLEFRADREMSFYTYSGDGVEAEGKLFIVTDEEIIEPERKGREDEDEAFEISYEEKLEETEDLLEDSFFEFVEEKELNVQQFGSEIADKLAEIHFEANDYFMQIVDEYEQDELTEEEAVKRMEEIDELITEEVNLLFN